MEAHTEKNRMGDQLTMTAAGI